MGKTITNGYSEILLIGQHETYTESVIGHSTYMNAGNGAFGQRKDDEDTFAAWELDAEEIQKIKSLTDEDLAKRSWSLLHELDRNNA